MFASASFLKNKGHRLWQFSRSRTAQWTWLRRTGLCHLVKVQLFWRSCQRVLSHVFSTLDMANYQWNYWMRNLVSRLNLSQSICLTLWSVCSLVICPGIAYWELFWVDDPGQCNWSLSFQDLTLKTLIYQAQTEWLSRAPNYAASLQTRCCVPKQNLMQFLSCFETTIKQLGKKIPLYMIWFKDNS